MIAWNHKAGWAVSVILCVVFFFLLISHPALSASGTTGDLSWSLVGGALTITGSGDMPEYSDASMPPWADVADQITRASVGEGVTSVGALTFYGCTNLRSVSLPSTVSEIGDRAFKFCRSLPYLRFPSGLESIGEAAFESCESLNGILLPDELQSIGHYAFDRCKSLSHITIPSAVTSMGSVLFHYCTSLTQVVIESPIKKLPDYTFYGCKSLNAVSLPDSVEEVGDSVFSGCNHLSGIYYNGNSGEVITVALEEGPSTRDAYVLEGEPLTNNGNLYVNGSNGVSIAVSNTENAAITKTLLSLFEYEVNGEPVDLEGVLAADETDVVTVMGSTSVTVSAVIHAPGGWDEVTRAAEGAIAMKSEDNRNVAVSIQLEDAIVTSRELSKMAGDEVLLTITTQKGNAWVIDEAKRSRGDFGQASYSLDFTITKLEELNRSGVSGETVYALDFSGDTDFQATVGVPLKVGDGRKTATLYQKVGNEVTALETVVVDDTGTAWFPVAGVSGDTSYYVAVNAPSVKREDAIIPISLAGDYNMDEGTLIGSDGTRYKVTGRSSRWGITGKEFAIYAAIGLGVVVLLVTLIMITMNKLAKSKAKYAVPPPDSSGDIDEEALRLELMKELLEEKKEK